jgi:phage terminase small subunit
MSNEEITAKQQLFIKEYLIDLNGTQAAIRAGYSQKTANEQASRLLANANIRAEVQKAMDKRSEDLGIDAKYVLQTIKNTIERCSQAEQVKGPDGTVSGEYKFDSSAVLKGAELLGKHLKMFTDKAEVEHKGAVQIIATSLDEKL